MNKNKKKKQNTHEMKNNFNDQASVKREILL